MRSLKLPCMVLLPSCGEQNKLQHGMESIQGTRYIISQLNALHLIFFIVKFVLFIVIIFTLYTTVAILEEHKVDLSANLTGQTLRL